MPSDALKDRWEYRRWYPIVILFNVSEKTRYQMSRAHCAPERCQLPEHDGGDENDLGHCRWGAAVDTISCSQVCTAKKDSVLPPDSRPPLRRTGSHKRAEGGDGRQRADIRGVNLFIRRIAVFSTVCAVVKLCRAVYIPKTALRITIRTWRARQRTDVHAEVAESSANAPHLADRIPIRHPNLPLIFLTCTHAHPHRPMNHSSFDPLSAAHVYLFQPIWQ